MRALIAAVSILCLAQPLLSHHGPWTRGYDTTRTVVIEGVIVKCVECGNRGRGHGILQVQVESVPWSVTLPDTPALRQGRVDLGKLKKGTAVRVTGFPNVSQHGTAVPVTGFPHVSGAHTMWATEIVSKGNRILWLDPSTLQSIRDRQGRR
jgi:hypothetical protein